MHAAIGWGHHRVGTRRLCKVGHRRGRRRVIGPPSGRGIKRRRGLAQVRHRVGDPAGPCRRRWWRKHRSRLLLIVPKVTRPHARVGIARDRRRRPLTRDGQRCATARERRTGRRRSRDPVPEGGLDRRGIFARVRARGARTRRRRGRRRSLLDRIRSVKDPFARLFVCRLSFLEGQVSSEFAARARAETRAAVVVDIGGRRGGRGAARCPRQDLEDWLWRRSDRRRHGGCGRRIVGRGGGRGNGGRRSARDR